MKQAKTWVISDCHFGHKNILNFRPQFSSIDEHNETIMQGIADAVSKHDTLWILGDMFFDSDALDFYGDRLREILSEGHIFMCLGNHDTDSLARASNVRRMTEVLDSVHALKSKDRVWYSHAPIHPAELRGRINIHGHVHSQTIPDERYFNACCENTDYKPVLIKDIYDGYRGILFPKDISVTPITPRNKHEHK